MIIDAHIHLYPPEIAGDPGGWAATHREPHWAELCTRKRRDGRPVQTFPSTDELLRKMDSDGVDKAVLLGWYWENPETCAWQNRFYAACVRAHPDRLAAFATVCPRPGTDALAEILRARAEGLVGLGELSPHSQRIAVNDPGWQAVLALAAELKLPVNFHVSDPGGRAYPGKIETPLADFIYLARQHPEVTFVLAHWGACLPVVQPQKALPNVYYDTAASPLLYDATIWPKMAQVAGPERILFGSDYPLILYPRTETEPGFAGLVAEARAAGFGRDALAAILGGNAARLLRL